MRRIQYLPLVGIIVGGVAGLLFASADALFESKALAALIAIAAACMITGSLVEKPTVGLVVGLLIRYQTLLLLPSRSIPMILIAAHAFSRFAAGSLAAGTQLSENDQPLSKRTGMLMAALGMLPLLLVGSLTFLLLVPVLWVIPALLAVWYSRKGGSYTSKRLLITQHTVEICFYLLVVLAYEYALTIPTT